MDTERKRVDFERKGNPGRRFLLHEPKMPYLARVYRAWFSEGEKYLSACFIEMFRVLERSLLVS